MRGVQEGTAIGIMVGCRQAANDRTRQNLLDEGVVLDQQLASPVGVAERLEEPQAAVAVVREIGPGREGANELHEDQAAHQGFVASRPIEAQSRSPVVQDQHDLAQAQRADKPFQVSCVIRHAVGNVGLVRLAEADQVRGDAAGGRCDVGNDVAPQVGRRRVAVQEQHHGRVPMACRPRA